MFFYLILLLFFSILCSSIIYFIPYHIIKYFQKRKAIVINNINSLLNNGIGQFPRTNFEKILLKYNGFSNKLNDIYNLYFKKKYASHNQTERYLLLYFISFDSEDISCKIFKFILTIISRHFFFCCWCFGNVWYLYWFFTVYYRE